MTVTSSTEPSPVSASAHGLRGFIGRVVPYLFVLAMVAYLATRRDDLARLGDARWSDLVVIAVLVVVGAGMNASEYWLMYRAAGVPIGFRENWALFNAGQLGNYLPMQVGTVYRFRYLKAVHGLRYANTASFLAMNLAITLGSTALCGLFGVAMVAGAGGHPTPWLLVAFFVVLLVVALVSALIPMRPASGAAPPSNRIVSAWHEFQAGWETVRQRPAIAAQVLAIDVVKLLLLAVRFAVAFRLLGVHAPIGVYLVVAPVTALVSAVAPTPGSLGIREGAIALVVTLLGYSVPTGLLAATIDRTVMLVVACVLGGIGYAVTRRRLRRTLVANNVVVGEFRESG